MNLTKYDCSIDSMSIQCFQNQAWTFGGLLDLAVFRQYTRLEKIMNDPSSKLERVTEDQIKFIKRLLKSRRRNLKANSHPFGIIGLIAHEASQTIYGGERSFIDMAAGLYQSGFRVITFLPQAQNNALLEILAKYSDSIYCFGYRQDRYAKDSSLIDKIFHCIAIAEGIEAFYANTITLTSICKGLKRNGYPVAIHAREAPLEDLYLCKAFNCTGEEMLARTHSSCDLIVCNSSYTLKQFNNSFTRMSVVPNTIRPEKFQKLAAKNMSQEGLKRDLLHVSIISSNVKKKGLVDFFYVAQQCARQRLAIKFFIYGPVTNYLKELISQFNAPNIEIMGYISDPIIGLRNTDILLTLSHFAESFGRTVLEALAAAIPVIGYDKGAIPDLIIDKKTGFLVPYKKKEIVIDILRKISEDPKCLEEIRKNALNHSQNFSFNSYKDALSSCVNTLLSKESKFMFNGLDRIVTRRKVRPSPARNSFRLAYFLWHFPVPSETFVLNELEELTSRGVDVIVFCKASPHKDFSPSFNIKLETVRDYIDLGNKLINHKISIVHSHFVYPTVTEMVWPACEYAGVPFTFIAHAQDIFKYENIKQNRVDEISQSPFCKKVFAPSSFHHRFLIFRGVAERKLARLANTIKVKEYQPSLESKQTGIESGKEFTIVAINRFVEKKGMENLILSSRLLPKNFLVKIYGYGELENRYQSIINSKKLQNVKLEGALKGREQLANALGNCNLFIAPYVRAKNGDMDGIPTVLMEALAAKSLVLATDISGVTDIIIPGYNGFICKPTPEDIANKIIEISQLSDEESSAIKSNGLATISGMYDVGDSVDKMLRIWQDDELDICIVTWNNSIETPEVIRRIHAYTDSPYHLIICDNNSKPLDRLSLASLYIDYPDQTSLIYGEKNVFVGPGTNKCLEQGTGDIAIYICGKEGFIFNHGWEDSFIKEIKRSDQKIGLVGTPCYSPTYFLAEDYASVDLYKYFRGKEYLLANPKKKMVHIQGGFFAINRKMYQEIGGFSESVPHNYTDVEYSLYAESNGWQFGRAKSVISLYNKTRPGIFSRINSNVKAIHPPALTDIPLIEDLLNANLVICNICEATQDRPSTHDFVCSKCGSVALDRSVFSFLAESDFLHRRIPAFIIDDMGGALNKVFIQHFQGPKLSSNEFTALVERDGRLINPDNRFELIIIRSTNVIENRQCLSELARILRPSGSLLLAGKAKTIAAELKYAFNFYLDNYVMYEHDFVFRPSTEGIAILRKA